MKRTLKIALMFLIAISFGTVISNAAEEFQNGNLKGTYNDDSTIAYVDSVVDTTVTEIVIPETINGADVQIRYSTFLYDLTNLESLTVSQIDDISLVNFSYATNLKELIIKQKTITETIYENTFSNLSKNVKIYAYPDTSLVSSMTNYGYTVESLGNCPKIFNYDSNGNIEGLNTDGLTEITVPDGIKQVRFAYIHGMNANTSIEEFGLDTIKKITFLTKDVIDVYDLGYIPNLEEIVGYTGNGIENLSSNVKFTSLGEVDNPVELFKYEVVDNEYIKITGLNKQYPDPLEIPSEINGLPVKEIGSFMSYYDWFRIKMLDTLIIPETVTKIASGSFTYLHVKNVYIYSKDIEFDESLLYFYWKGYTITSGAKVYAYDESGLKDIVENSEYSGTYVSLNKSPEEPDNTDEAKLTYTTHVQNIGWQDYVSDGEMAGTSGKGLRLEGIKIKLETNLDGGIEYSTHIQNIGWQTPVNNDEMSGTSGKSLRLEGIKMNLTGELAEKYDIYYRVHAQNFGWLDWACNGEKSGTEGYAFRLEGIEVKLLEKGAEAPGETDFPVRIKEPNIEYTTHVQNVGWQEYVSNGQMSGTSGKSLRLEGIKINLGNQRVSGGIEYSTHIQNIGWQDYVSKDEMSGTSGRSLRLEAIKIRLTGELAEMYDVYYRVHAQNAGWLGWAKNDEPSGTAGYGFRLEGIEMKIVPKGENNAPGSLENAFVQP